jgi:hypothetical protein
MGAWRGVESVPVCVGVCRGYASNRFPIIRARLAPDKPRTGSTMSTYVTHGLVRTLGPGARRPSWPPLTTIGRTVNIRSRGHNAKNIVSVVESQIEERAEVDRASAWSTAQK